MRHLNQGTAAMPKQFVAFARVSSREQEREGFSLDVQEETLRRYAEKVEGRIVKLFKVAETASKRDERKTFKELLAYARANARKLDAVLFAKVDRAARNLFDYVELERLESEHGVRFISVTQPTEANPAGRMMRRTLASMASFFTEQMAVDIKGGIERRVREGWFANVAPYGYKNVREDGRGHVVTHERNGPNVTRLFELFATGAHTIDSVRAAMLNEGRAYRNSTPKFPRTSVHTMLRDRAYVGEVQWKGQYYPGKHPSLVDHATFVKVQAFLGVKTYKHHASFTYAGGLIRCGCCGNLVTAEQVTKKSGRQYVYLLCAKRDDTGLPGIMWDGLRRPKLLSRHRLRPIHFTPRRSDADGTKGPKSAAQMARRNLLTLLAKCLNCSVNPHLRTF